MSDRVFEPLPYYSKTDQMIYEASKGNTQPLVDYLISDKPLDIWDRLKLAYLIHRFLGPKKRGHPPGRTKIVIPHLTDDAELFISRQVKSKLAQICKQSGRKRPPRGKANELIAIAVKEAEKWEFPEVGVKGLKLSAART